jgi:HK97 gp10 family phage protein
MAKIQERTKREGHLDGLGTFLAIGHRDKVDVKDGTLRGSIRHKVTRGGKLLVGVGREAFHWRFLEFGTEPHAIEARRARSKRRKRGAKVLADPDTGVVYGTRYMHPGQPARPFIRPVLDENRIGMTKALAKSYQRSTRAAVK